MSFIGVRPPGGTMSGSRTTSAASPCQAQCFQVIPVGHDLPQPNLDTQDHVTILLDGLDGQLGVGVAQLQQLSV